MSDTVIKLGDLVKHKVPSNNGITMTVHSFFDFGRPVGLYEHGFKWVLCQWFDDKNFCYQQTRFNVDELEKVS